MSEFSATNLNCPCCELTFETQLVVGYRIGDKDSDFCPRYLDGNPLPRFLHVCPECGFVGFEADYRNLTDKDHIRKVRTLLKGFHWTRGQELGGAERYRRAALIGIYINKRSATVADLYLQATWCARMEGEPDDDQRGARKKAIKYFQLALEAGEFAEDDLPVVHYLLGELNRRLGNNEEALIHFDRLDDLKHVDDWLKEWRDRQRELVTGG